mgnify:CR=1 FL=1
MYKRQTGNLDSENSRNIVDILLSLAHDEGRCVIVVTHDPEEAALLGGRCLDLSAL